MFAKEGHTFYNDLREGQRSNRIVFGNGHVQKHNLLNIPWDFTNAFKKKWEKDEQKHLFHEYRYAGLK
jgi:hypothetical protein